MEIAVSCSVLTFNSGKQSMAALLEKLHATPGPLSLAYFDSKDKQRLHQSRYVMKNTIKNRRKYKRRQKAATEEDHVEAEGPLYEAGGF